MTSPRPMSPISSLCWAENFMSGKDDEILPDCLTAFLTQERHVLGKHLDNMLFAILVILSFLGEQAHQPHI